MTTCRQITELNITMKYFTLALLINLTGCSYMLTVPSEQSTEPVYKYNALEMRQELTHPDSKIRYNVYSREWIYVK